MQINHHIWQDWAWKLHQWGVADIAASILEAGAPLTTYASQVLVAFSPFARGTMMDRSIIYLYTLFEDHSQQEIFLSLLREGKSN